MFAIVDIAGQQMKVEKDQKLYVHRLEGEAGSQVEFSQVFLLDQEGKVTVGTPLLDGVSVSAKILAHVKGDKVLVFKKKRRKGYQTLNGHRQFFSQIQIEDIITGGKKKKTTRASREETSIPEAESPAPEEPQVTTEN